MALKHFGGLGSHVIPPDRPAVPKPVLKGIEKGVVGLAFACYASWGDDADSGQLQLDSGQIQSNSGQLDRDTGKAEANSKQAEADYDLRARRDDFGWDEMGRDDTDRVRSLLAFGNSRMAFGNSWIASRNSRLAFRNSWIAFRNSWMAFGNSWIASRNSRLAFGNSWIASRNSRLAFGNSWIAFRNSRIAFSNSPTTRLHDVETSHWCQGISGTQWNPVLVSPGAEVAEGDFFDTHG